MEAHEVTPILNVTDVEASVRWFERFGWTKRWDWCPPGADAPTFGSVGSGGLEIFLCLDGQGGRGEHGTWVSLWVDDVDAIHDVCVREGLEVVSAPEDELWGVREVHVRHPDGHVFRVSAESPTSTTTITGTIASTIASTITSTSTADRCAGRSR